MEILQFSNVEIYMVAGTAHGKYERCKDLGKKAESSHSCAGHLGGGSNAGNMVGTIMLGAKST